MNFEYKVGYLWKTPEKDPGQQSWDGRFFNKTARTGYPIRPSGFCDKTANRAPCFQAAGHLLFTVWDVLHLIWIRDRFEKIFLFFFSLSFSLLSLVHLFFLLFLVKRAVPRGFKGVPSSGSKILNLEKCSEGFKLQRTTFRIQILRILLKYRPIFCISKLLSSSPNIFLVKVGII